MIGTTERRFRIIEELCNRRHIAISQLATEFSVYRSTIQKDIDVISTLIPVYTTRGGNGGVHVLDGYHLGMKYLTDEQCRLLEQLSTSLTGEDLKLMWQILKTFRKPALQK